MADRRHWVCLPCHQRRLSIAVYGARAGADAALAFPCRPSRPAHGFGGAVHPSSAAAMGWSPIAVAVPGSLSADSSSAAWAPPSDGRRPFVRRVRRRAQGGWPGQWAFHPPMAALMTCADPAQPGRRMSGWMVSGMVGHALAPWAVVLLGHWAGSSGLVLLGVPGLIAAALLYESARGLPPAHTASLAVPGRIVEYSPTTRPPILFGGGVAQSGDSQSAHAAAHSAD